MGKSDVLRKLYPAKACVEINPADAAPRNQDERTGLDYFTPR